MLLLAGVAPAFADKRVALVIGNAAYAQVGPLANSGADAALVAEALKADGFDVTEVRDVNRSDMLAALDAFNDKADAADWALVYYAGHGMEVGGVNYLLPVDAKMRADRNAQDEAVTLERVQETVKNAHKLRIVILDACRNNPFSTTMKRTSRVRAVERGLARVEPESGTLVVYAAEAGQVADDGEAGHSPFTLALAKRLQEPGLEVSRLFNVVAADVMSATGSRQRPFQYGSNPTLEEFYFKPAAPVAKVEAPAGFDQTWKFLKASKEPAPLRAFLDALPPDHPLRAEVEARIAEAGGAKQEVAALTAPPPQVVAPKPAEPTECDRLAASPNDPDLPRGFPAVDFNRLNAEPAVSACRSALSADPNNRRIQFQLARAMDKGKQYDESRKLFETAAAGGSSAAMTGLGLLYDNGEGVPKNLPTAREWMEKAAAGGNATAMNYLGVVYSNGEDVPKNPQTAREWFEKAAAGGYAGAMYALGALSYNGEGVPKNPQTAREWFEKAAAGGNAGAMLSLGFLSYSGEGVPKDLQTARKWYEKAAASGDAQAMFNLGALSYSGEGVPKNLQTAREWFEKAAAGGEAEAMYKLGLLYHDGEGVPKSVQAAQDWWEKAAAGGNAGALIGLGSLYKNGEGVPKNLQTAYGWFEKAAAGGDATAMFYIGLYYEKGEDAPQNFELARRWYEKAAAGGNAPAMTNLGSLWENGEGVPASLQTAREWYAKAAAAGDADAKNALARLKGKR